MLRILVVLLVLIPALPGHAAQWNVLDLGRLYKDQHCLAAAKSTFRNMLGEVRIDRLHASDWVAYADGINGAHDALITCTFGDNRGTRATLVMHSEAAPINAHLLMRRIETVFVGQAAAITKAWKDSFN